MCSELIQAREWQRGGGLPRLLADNDTECVRVEICGNSCARIPPAFSPSAGLEQRHNIKATSNSTSSSFTLVMLGRLKPASTKVKGQIVTMYGRGESPQRHVGLIFRVKFQRTSSGNAPLRDITPLFTLHFATSTSFVREYVPSTQRGLVFRRPGRQELGKRAHSVSSLASGRDNPSPSRHFLGIKMTNDSQKIIPVSLDV